jgi:multimeric flavodoxin WrbA
MKVLLFNGSPHETGCTYTALKQTAQALEENGIETEIVWLGKSAIGSCWGCGACRKGLGKCVQQDVVNELAEKCDGADGFVFGSPVHYAAASGALTSFMGRLFFSAGKKLSYKPAAAIVSCRRGGASAAFDQINKFFTINNMPVVSANYWNQVHGSTSSDVEKDEEGLQTARIIGYNMAWILKCIELGKTAGITPQTEPKIKTDFIR